MNRGLLIRLLMCVLVFGLFLYAYLNQMVAITNLRLQIPHLAKDVHTLMEENRKLRYEIECFENPVHLLELSRKPEFGHLRFPKTDEVMDIAHLKFADKARGGNADTLAGSAH